MRDSLLALAAANALDTAASLVTSDLRVSFERPGSSGRVFGRTRVESKSERSISTTGELAGEDGKEIARGTATQRIRRTREAR
jgi:acyl-coenzyme A thioesterase PaaI-like protein